MYTDKIAKAVTALLLLVVVTAPAAAAVWSFDFESLVPGQYSVMGLIYTTDTLNVLGNFDVTAITGTVNGAPMGSLLANPNQPNVYVAPNRNSWDNNLIPGAPFVTHRGGIGFNFQGDQLVLFSGPGGNPLSEGLFSQNAQQTTFGTLRVTGTTAPDLNRHGLTGSWFQMATAGQGVEVEVYPDLIAPGTGFMQAAWFTYDYKAPDGAGSQRWYTFSGNVQSGQPSAMLTLYENTGGNFDAPPVTMAMPVGNVVVSAADCGHLTMTYTFTDGSGRSGMVPMTRLLPNVTCVASGPETPNADFGYSGNWYDKTTSGQGIVFELNPNQPLAWLAWYTYAPNGQALGEAGQRWYTAQAAYTPGARSVVMTLYETTGGLFDKGAPAPTTVPVGTATATFSSCTALKLDFNFTGGSSAGASGTINMTRVGPTPSGCGP